jgi:hypothetical protein
MRTLPRAALPNPPSDANDSAELGVKLANSYISKSDTDTQSTRKLLAPLSTSPVSKNLRRALRASAPVQRSSRQPTLDRPSIGRQKALRRGAYMRLIRPLRPSYHRSPVFRRPSSKRLRSPFARSVEDGHNAHTSPSRRRHEYIPPEVLSPPTTTARQMPHRHGPGPPRRPNSRSSGTRNSAFDSPSSGGDLGRQRVFF